MKNEIKLSHYIVFSDSLNDKGDVVVYSTRSGELFLVSKQIKENLVNESFHAISAEIIESLYDKKVLVDKSENELLTISRENKSWIATRDTLYEVIQPSANCQLGCDYCGQDHKKINIDDNVSLKILERIQYKIDKSNKNYKRLSIGWFGGEPLMALNRIRSLSNALQELAKKNDMTYSASIVTNGLSLKEDIYLELCQELGVRSMEVTLDGTSEFHDSRRHLKAGSESFDLIFKNLKTIYNRPDYFELGCPISIRCNVDERNFQGVSPLITYLAKHNLQDKISYFYPIGVYSWGGNDAHRKSLTKEEYAQMEIDWYIEMLEQGFRPSVIPNRTYELCIAVTDDSEMFDPYGNIFNCTEVSLTDHYKNTEYVLGNLKFDNKDFTAPRPLSDWNDTILEDKFPCHTCNMLPVCGGGCPKAWYEDMRACPSAKFNMKERLALAYVLTKAESEEFFNLTPDSGPVPNIGLGTR